MTATRWLAHPWLTVRVQIALGVLFIAAALPKIVDPPSFAHMIFNYRMVPGGLVNSAALFLPWVELFLGWSLILGLFRKASAAAAGALFASFLFALVSVQAKGIQLPNCGCFGDAIHFTPLQALLFDTCLAVLCWLAWRSEPTRLSLDSWAEGGYTAPTHGKR